MPNSKYKSNGRTGKNNNLETNVIIIWPTKNIRDVEQMGENLMTKRIFIYPQSFSPHNYTYSGETVTLVTLVDSDQNLQQVIKVITSDGTHRHCVSW